jgi:hypothetical protein
LYFSRKEVSADGKIVKVFYYNGDLKERRLSVFSSFSKKKDEAEILM